MSIILIIKVSILIFSTMLLFIAAYGLYHKKEILRSVNLIKRYHQVERSINNGS